MANQTKVKLPRGVAEEIEHMRSAGYSDAVIFLKADSEYSLLQKTYEWAFSSVFEIENKNILMSALVNGYEVEKSPEDKVREYYDKFSEPDVGRFVESEQYVIAKTLNLLGITIEGINDKEESE